MKFTILSAFPELIRPYLENGVIGQAKKKQLFQCDILNPRDFVREHYKSIDDRPFGGGDGMVLLPEILEACLSSQPDPEAHVVYLSPQGKKLNERKVGELFEKKSLTLICGRYSGVDQRFLNAAVDEEISIGDYVISGGELAALVVVDALVRKIPGALGHQDSASADSFSQGLSEGLLEAPLFTRPSVWRNQGVPDVLLSGHHGAIANWRKMMSFLVTLKKRPDLLPVLSQDQKNELYGFFSSLTDRDKEACGIQEVESLVREYCGPRDRRTF